MAPLIGLGPGGAGEEEEEEQQVDVGDEVQVADKHARLDTQHHVRIDCVLSNAKFILIFYKYTTAGYTSLIGTDEYSFRLFGEVNK
jgi:hypothetical protein